MRIQIPKPEVLKGSSRRNALRWWRGGSCQHTIRHCTIYGTIAGVMCDMCDRGVWLQLDTDRRRFHAAFGDGPQTDPNSDPQIGVEYYDWIPAKTAVAIWIRGCTLEIDRGDNCTDEKCEECMRLSKSAGPLYVMLRVLRLNGAGFDDRHEKAAKAATLRELKALR